MTRAIAYSLNSIEELERLEHKESRTVTKGQVARPSTKINWLSFNITNLSFLRMLSSNVPIVASSKGLSRPS